VKRLPRAAGPLVWTVGVAAVHGAVPFALSRLGDHACRRGAARRPVGLPTVAAGAGLIAWALATHYRAAPRGWSLASRTTPEYLLRSGPYRWSRNPMYAGEAVVWLGWALFYGTPAVWAGWAILCARVAKVVRLEERRLAACFGDAYRAYLAAVPRWVGRPPRRVSPGRGR
jgi:protein-S-isoprenylcysteine O-methyltransferase Ste14